MDAIFGLKELAARKRALAAESEAYRQTLGYELHNLRLYGEQTRRKFSFFTAMGPLLSVGAPLAGSIFGKRQSKWLRTAKAAFAGWQLYKRFTHRNRRDPSAAAADAEKQSSAGRH